MKYQDTTDVFAPPPQVVVRGRGPWDRPLPPGPAALRLDGPVTPPMIARAQELLAGRPDVSVRVFHAADLDFLADLPPVADLEVYEFATPDLSGLRHQRASLRRLSLFCHLDRRLDATPLADLTGLTHVYLTNNDRRLTHVDDVLPQLKELRHLVLHGVTLNEPAVLGQLSRLTGVAFKGGGNRDVSGLVHLPRLQFVEINQVRMFDDLSPLAECAALEVLHLEGLPRAEIPDMSTAHALAHVSTTALPLRRGLRGLAAAPALRQLQIIGSTATIEDIEVLRRHPTLEAAYIDPPAGHDGQTLGLPHPHDAPWAAFAARVQALPPVGWDGPMITASDCGIGRAAGGTS